MQRRRSDATTVNRAGQVEHWMICANGPLLAKIEMVRCSDSKTRIASITEMATEKTFYGSVRVSKKEVPGTIYEVEGVWHFTSDKTAKNGALLPKWSVRQKGKN